MTEDERERLAFLEAQTGALTRQMSVLLAALGQARILSEAAMRAVVLAGFPDDSPIRGAFSSMAHPETGNDNRQAPDEGDQT